MREKELSPPKIHANMPKKLKIYKHPDKSIQPIKEHKANFVSIFEQGLHKSVQLPSDTYVNEKTVNIDQSIKASAPKADNKHFSVKEDVSVISACYFYRANKNNIILTDIIDQLCKKLNRSYKSVKKRVERLKRLEEGQVRVFLEYHEKYRKHSDKRKIVFGSKGKNIFLCPIKGKTILDDEKRNFKEIRTQILAHYPEPDNADNIIRVDSSSDLVSDDAPLANDNSYRSTIESQRADISPNTDVIEHGNTSTLDQNALDPDDSDTAKDDTTSEDSSLECANDKPKLVVNNLLSLDDILIHTDTFETEQNREIAKSKYLKTTRDTKPDIRALTNELMAKVRTFEVNDPLDLIHTQENNIDKELLKINDVCLYNIVIDVYAEEKARRICLRSKNEVESVIEAKPKKIYIDVTSRDFIEEGYGLIKKLHNISEAIDEEPPKLKRLKRIKEQLTEITIPNIVLKEPKLGFQRTGSKMKVRIDEGFERERVDLMELPLTQ